MNRRDFLASLNACVLASAIPTLAELLPQPNNEIADTLTDEGPSSAAEIGRRYAWHLAQSLAETKETLTMNILNRVFEKQNDTDLSDRVRAKLHVAYQDWHGVYGSAGA